MIEQQNLDKIAEEAQAPPGLTFVATVWPDNKGNIYIPADVTREGVKHDGLHLVKDTFAGNPKKIKYDVYISPTK